MYGIPIRRRSLLVAAGASGLLAFAPRLVRASSADNIDKEIRLTPAPGRVALAGATYPESNAWCYDGTVPGPEIRLRQGERIRIVCDNRLAQDTTIHWHGIRVPNPMDGVPYVTQPPIQSGASFTYDFTVPDAGTYWYHPHDHSSEQIGRGMMGAFVIEEPAPLPVDREVVWVLGDFRLLPDARIVGNFDNPMEMSMAGRIGNTVTINGRVPTDFAVRSGERIRLRLINAATARIFGLEFRQHRPLIVALDGQPIAPHPPDGGRVVLAPAQRIDLLLDMNGTPGSKASIVDTFYRHLSYRLVDLTYIDATPLRTKPLAPPAQLARNTQPEPDLGRAQQHVVTLTGGMMGGGAMWAINGMAIVNDDMRHMKPILTLTRSKTYVLAIDNRTAWYHPIHLHGHSFRVITRNGKPTRYRAWRDTVLMPPREHAEIAFVADNPGDWMFHCHILDHQDGGMMAVIRVT